MFKKEFAIKNETALKKALLEAKVQMKQYNLEGVKFLQNLNRLFKKSAYK